MSDNTTSKNPITGDLIASKIANKLYRDNYDHIFKKKEIVRSKCECKECKCKKENTDGSPRT